jgi:hypothetical protein
MKSGIPANDFRINGDPHIGFRGCPCPDHFRFAFVRHPLDLYRSYWQFKMTYGWDDKNVMDQACCSEHFQTFVTCILERFPGIVSNSLDEFFGENYDQVNFVGKYENLVDDLIFVLRIAGETYSEECIRKLPPCNVSDKTKYPAAFTPMLVRRIMISEQRMIERFGYD